MGRALKLTPLKSDQTLVILQIKKLAEQLPPALRKKYLPKPYHSHPGIGGLIMSYLEHVPCTVNTICNALSHEYDHEVSSGVVKYHLDKMIRNGDAYLHTLTTPREYALTQILRLKTDQPDNPHRMYYDGRGNIYYNLTDKYGQTTWYDAELKPLPRRIKCVID